MLCLRMPRYCPVPLAPSLCFETTYMLRWLPFNGGPFALLVMMKVVVPRSSFQGHLCGLLLGFPLAWGAMDWVSPPVLARASVARGRVCVGGAGLQ